MDKLVSTISSAPTLQSKNDDDFADRLSSRYTVACLIVFALIVTGAAYFGSPITCWAPVHFTGSHTTYANSYCWVRNTYYLPFEEDIPKEHEDEKRQTIYYYQWIPFILLGQAIFFYFPSIVWHAFNSKGGIDADNILESSNSLSRTDKVEKRETTLTFIANQMDRFLAMRKDNEVFHCDPKSILSATLCRPCGRRFGNYLVFLFMFSKVLYIANCLAQLFVLNKVLSMNFTAFGFDISENIMANHDWTEAEHVAFPRVTMCDFKVRRLGNIHRYTLQCALPINMYNEKIYLFLWFWIVFVGLFSVASFFTWFLRIIMYGDRKKFVKNHLKLGRKLNMVKSQQVVDDFVGNYLKQDGCFILRLIAHNTNNITTTEVICAIWDKWYNRKYPSEPTAPSEMAPAMPIDPMTKEYQPLIQQQGPDVNNPVYSPEEDDDLDQVDTIEKKPLTDSS